MEHETPEDLIIPELEADLIAPLSDSTEYNMLAIHAQEAAQIMELCRSAFQSFSGAQAGFVPNPPAAWEELTAAARRISQAPTYAAVDSDQTSLASKITDESDSTESLGLSVPTDGFLAEKMSFVLHSAEGLLLAQYQEASVDSSAQNVVVRRVEDRWVVSKPNEGMKPHLVETSGRTENVSQEAIEAAGKKSVKSHLKILGRGEIYEPEPDPEFDEAFDEPGMTRDEEILEAEREIEEYRSETEDFLSSLRKHLESLEEAYSEFKRMRDSAPKETAQQLEESEASVSPSEPASERKREPVSAPVEPAPDAPEDREQEERLWQICGNRDRGQATQCSLCGHSIEASKAGESPRPSARDPQAQLDTCPVCGSPISPQQPDICLHCGHGSPDSGKSIEAEPVEFQEELSPRQEDYPEPEADPEPIEEPGPAVCPSCGTERQPDRRFCTRCGQRFEDPVKSAPPPPNECPNCRRPLKPGIKFCPSCGEKVSRQSATPREAPTPRKDSSPETSADDPPPPPPSGKKFTMSEAATSRGTAEATEAGDPDLPPAPKPWGLQLQLTRMADQLTSSLRQSEISGGKTSVFERVIRACLLDQSTYRRVAEDPALHGEAWIVAAAIILSSSVGVLFFALVSFSTYVVVSVVTTFLIQLVAWMVRVWAVQLAASNWLERSTSFEQFFRAITYAQAPALLAFIPLVGQLLALWSLVTTTAAIRDVTGSDTWSAVALSVVGWVGVYAATYMAAALI